MKKTIFPTLAFFAVLFCFFPILAKASEREKILLASSQMFGKAVDEKQNLFEVNRFYALRVEFNKGGKLSLFAVEPKYYFEESRPEWKEPVDFELLSAVQYKNLLTQLEQIKSKGRLVTTASAISAVTNMTAWYTEIYENAALTWGKSVDLRRGENAPYEVKWFKISYEKDKN